MSDGERKPAGPAEPSISAEAARRRPNPPTLDLTATEIASQATESAAQAAADPALSVSEPRRPVSEHSPSAEEISAAIEEWIRPDEPLRVRIESGEHEPSSPPPPPTEPPVAAQAAAAAPPPSHFGRGVALGIGAALLGAAAALGTLWSLGEWPRQDDSAAMTARIGAIETNVSRLASRPAPPVVSDQHIAEIAAKAVAAQNAGASSADQLKNLEARLAKAEAALATLPGASADAALNERISSLDGNAKALATDIESMRKRLDEMSTAAQAARDAAMRSSGAASTATAEVSSDLDALKQRTAALESKAAKPAPDIDRVARTAAVAAALRDTVERGAPYADELAAAKALAAGPAIFAPLEPFAATGLPTTAALANELRAIAAKTRAAALANEKGGLFERLQAHAEKLVRIRPANEAARPEPGDFTVAEQAAARGDLAGAVAALRALPAPVRAPADAWITRVEARQAALDFARKQSRDAVAALAQQPK
ncbi:MAG: hypothetical protein J0H17_11395 [Rhizobiales bacterium]|nr:hypothetical protein [Hyphomicrobiales bacterium]